jgi:hypothetical protein
MNDITKVFTISVSIAGGLLTLITLFKIIKPFQKFREWFTKPVITNLTELDIKNNATHEELKRHITEISDKVLKLMVCSESIPLDERVDYGREYVDVRGLNGSIKIQHKINCELLEKQLKNKHK